MNRRMIECNKCQECLNQKILLDFQNNADILLESHFKLISISIYVNLKKIVYKS